MTEEQRLADLADECIERLLAGEAPGDILRMYPADAEALRPLLQSAVSMHVPVPPASAGARSLAMSSMMTSIEHQRGLAAAGVASAGGLGAMLGWFSRQPMAAKGLAAVAGLVMLGGVAAGASAAGATPKPVQELFGFSESSAIRVEFQGVIRGIDAANGALTVEAGADVRTVIIDNATELEDDNDDDLAFEDFVVGDVVEVNGSLQPDNTILADHVERDGDDDATGAPTSEPFETPPPVIVPEPTADFDDDVDDDNRGPGGDGDEDDDDDGVDDDDDGNEGPGGGDDDDDDDGDDDGDGDDDSSGPGSGNGGHGDDDDNSGPGNGGQDDGDDDDDDDDDGGSGSGNSGSGGDDDDDDDSGDDD